MKLIETHKKSIFTKAIIVSAFAALIVASVGTNQVSAKKLLGDGLLNKNSGAISNGAVEVVSYDLNAVVSKDHSYKVVEKIDVNLPSDTQSIDFEIPHGNFRISGLKVENADYSSNQSDDDSKVTIVDADKLTAGSHTYTIEYTIKEFADRDTAKDIFYFDVMVPSWSHPVYKVNIKVSFPDDFPWTDMQYYAGQYGVQAVDDNIEFTANYSTRTVTIEAQTVPENFGIALKSELPNGYWEGALDGNWANLFMMGVMLVVVVVLAIMWIVGGRDPKIAKTTQTRPIDGVTPAEIGYLVTGHVHSRDVVSLVIYMATKGYLKISEYEPKKYCLIRQEYPSKEQKFIRNTYDTMFEDVLEGRSIEMEQVAYRLKRIDTAIKDYIAAGFSGKDMAASTGLSKAFRLISIALYSIALGVSCAMKYSYQYLDIDYVECVAVILLGIATSTLLAWQYDKQYFSETQEYKRVLILAALGFVAVPIYVAAQSVVTTGTVIPAIVVFIASVICGFFIMIMRARSKGNATLTSKLIQLRHFIYHPTPKEIAANYFSDNNYYYEILPYALLFSALDSWSITFLTLKVPAPEWYSDDTEGHAGLTNIRVKSSVDYARDISIFYRTMVEAYREIEQKG